MSRFQMPTAPKNGLDLLRWAIFEPVLLERFEKTLSLKKALQWLLRGYFFIIVSISLFWLTGMLLIVIVDLPTRFPNEYQTTFLTEWEQNPDLFSRYIVILEKSISLFIIGLLIGVSCGLGNQLLTGMRVPLFEQWLRKWMDTFD